MTTIEIVPVGRNFGWCAVVRRGGRIIAETDIYPFPEAARRAAEGGRYVECGECYWG